MREESVYQQALGAAFHDLAPGLRRYFGAIPHGSVGVGRGVFAEAGSRLRMLRPVWALLARRRILFAEFGHDVPFTAVNTRMPDGSLAAARTVEFGTVRRVMVDRMSVERGRLVDRIGRRGELEAELTASIHDGALQLESRRLALRVGRLRIPLPRFATVRVQERAVAAGQAVDLRITMPIIGEVFGYAGTFTYDFAPEPAESTPDCRIHLRLACDEGGFGK